MKRTHEIPSWASGGAVQVLGTVWWALPGSAGVRDANGFKFLLTDHLGSMVSMIEDGAEGDTDDIGGLLSE